MKKPKFKWDPEQLKFFWGWINERHQIYLRKKEGLPQTAWTKDPILLEYKFTNVFRQIDRVTEAWTDRFVRLLGRGKNMTDGDLLFHCAMFRLFNLPATYDALYYGLTKDWDCKKAIEILSKRRDEDHEQIFTGAYIIPNGGSKEPKIDVICGALDFLYDGRTDEDKKNKVKPRRHRIAKSIVHWKSMEDTVTLLQEVPTIGPFIAYEIACDLRHTRLLADAFDINSWANAGPGAKRGIHRLLTGKASWKGDRPDYNEGMHQLLTMAPTKLKKHVKDFKAWPFEMREIEHSLCEYDKWSRVKNGEGRPRSKYRHNPQQELPF